MKLDKWNLFEQPATNLETTLSIGAKSFTFEVFEAGRDDTSV